MNLGARPTDPASQGSQRPTSAATATKIYPPRGPLEQYRFASLTEFTCYRCGAAKKSKLLVTVDGDWDQLLCNGCYGRLVSIWLIKAGDLPDDQRDTAILELLRSGLAPESVDASRESCARRSSGFVRLSPEAQQMLATAHAVTEVLRAGTGLDWSAAVIGLCKAAEIEILRTVIEPIKTEVSGQDLDADLADKDLARVARYCANRAPAPELGAAMHFLQTARSSVRRAPSSPLIQAFASLAAGWERRDWLLGSDGLIPMAQRLGREFRNPAAHTALLTESDFDECVALVEGADGILAHLLVLRA